MGLDRSLNRYSAACIRVLNSGGIAVLPTDTVYGIVAGALRPDAVNRLYQVRRRTCGKPCIILLSSSSELLRFGIVPDQLIGMFINEHWPGPHSVIFPLSSEERWYLHRGTRSLAFRVPGDPALRALLEHTGPLVAPSANPEGLPPATTIGEAREYFGDEVDYYCDGGVRNNSPSSLWSSDGTTMKRLR